MSRRLSPLSWLDAYSSVIGRLWTQLPQRISPYIVTLSVFAFGITIRGEWIIVFVHILRQFGLLGDLVIHEDAISVQKFSWSNISLRSLYLEGLPQVWIICNSVGYVMYFFIGGFLHFYFYVKQRDRSDEWKCQPSKWLPPELELDEIIYGCKSLVATNTFSSLLTCYIINGGWSTIYYNFDQYSWMWYFLQWPLIFCYQDYTTYLLHRWYHTPWLYKRFHKVHHKYVQPTAFSVTAIHPFEIIHIQMTLCVPLFTIPTHWTSFTMIGLYTYYNGIMDHSGVDFKAPWWQPWRPDTIFHDNHHQYFHVNFGFNCYFWDMFHGTFRRPDRIYKEDIFYGKGKPLSEASSQEMEEEIKNRLTENPKAHRHINPFLNHPNHFDT